MGKSKGSGSALPLLVASAAGVAGALVVGKFVLSRDGAGSYEGTYGKDAPGILVRFDLSPGHIRRKVKQLIAESDRVHNQVAAVPLDKVTFKNVVEPLAELEAQQFPLAQSLEFPAMVSASKTVRDASTEAEKALNAYSVKCSMREDVYRVIKAYAAKKEALSPEQQRYVDRLVRDFERLGLALDEVTRKEVEKVKTRMGELSIEFQKNLNEENTILEFTTEELDGISEDLLKSLKTTASGGHEVTLKYPHYFPIMRKCKVSDTRRKLENAFNSRCLKENTPILEELVKLRAEMAKLLGFRNHSAYVLDVRMAKNPEKVTEFLESVSEKISVLAAKELNKLSSLKMKDEGALDFGMADLRFYMNKVEEEELKIDYEAVKKYFPLEVVTQGLLNIYQKILGLAFKEIKNPHTWHPDVQLYEVTDSKTGELMGHFYLDLHPREAKYGHACVCTLQHGCTTASGERMSPVAAMLANFTKPTVDRPSLLSHDEVTTYFHEFGHVMHVICSHTQYARFSGTRVERDFVEAPSQMLENWCWEPESLRLMSGHFEDTSKPLPDDMLATLISTRVAHAGLLTKRQLLFGLFDQTIHRLPEVDTGAILAELHPKVMMGIPMTPGTNFASSFGHLAGGYDASYYGYMWSEVFSADMFASKFKGRVLSPDAGMEYRKKILLPGGSKDATELLRDFLGREPNEEAFLRSKGIDSAAIDP